MSRPSVVRAVAVAVSAPVVLAATAGAASAATPSRGMGKLKAAADHSISQRLTTLNSDARTISFSASLSAVHRDRLAALVRADVDGLTALRAKIAVDTTAAAVRTDAADVFTRFRVYAVLQPQVSTVIRADQLSAEASRVLAASATVTGKTALEKARLAQSGTLLNDAQAIDAAAAQAALAISPSDSSLGLTPTALIEARSSLATAREDILGARGLIKNVQKADTAS